MKDVFIEMGNILLELWSKFSWDAKLAIGLITLYLSIYVVYDICEFICWRLMTL